MILVVTQTFAPATGGMEAYMTGLADHLALAGYETCVLADGTTRPFAPQAPYTLRRFGGWRPWRRFQKRRAVAALLATGKVQGIFCDSWKSIESLPASIAVPVVVLAHGADHPATPSPRKRQRIAAALARSTGILANSRFTADAVRAFLPGPNDPRLSIVHPPIDPLPVSSEDEKEMRALIGAKHPVIASIARFEPRKGMDRVIAALPALIQKHPSLVLCLGGDGEDKARLQALAQEKGVSDHVLFLGLLTKARVAALLAASDLFAMPVRRVGRSVEGFGIVYIEAAWFGVPSLGGIGSGAEDAVIDGETGLLTDGADQDSVTAALARLLDNESERRAFGLAAKTRVETTLLWSQALPRFLAALRIKQEE